MKCSNGRVQECALDRSICASKAGKYLRHDFPTCPIRAALDDPSLMYVLSLESQMETSPVSDWPDGFAAWVVDLLSAIKEIRHAKQEDDLKRARNGRSRT